MSSQEDSVKRLSSYRRVLYKLKSLGFIRVFSDNLADALGLSPAQVRKDFSIHGLTGNKKSGYVVSELLERLDVILGKNDVLKVAIVGCGKMGSALMNYNGFSGEGMKVVAGFDSTPSLIDPQARIPILDIDDMPDFIMKENVKIAILTVPESAAARTMDQLVSCGIRGILNFTPIPFKNTENCIVHNINIAIELENMFYFVKNLENKDLGKK